MADTENKKVQFSDTGFATEGTNQNGSIGAFTSPPEDHEIYNLIGRIASGWAHLEHILDRTIWKLAKLPGSRGACLTAQMMGVWPRLNAIDALLIQRAAKLPALASFIKPMRSFAQNCRSASENRNRIVHDPWYSDQNGQIARFLSMPKGMLVYGLEEKDRAEIETLITQIKTLAARAEELRNAIYTQLAA